MKTPRYDKKKTLKKNMEISTENKEALGQKPIKYRDTVVKRRL